MKYLLILMCMLLGACTPNRNIKTSTAGYDYWSDTVFINGHKIVNIHNGFSDNEIMGSFEASDCPKCYDLFD